MNQRQQLNRAIEIALEAHHGQYNQKTGLPYIEHPMRVMSAGQTIEEKIVGALHDVVEDTDWTLDDLTREGFPSEVVAAVDALTRRENESYNDYLERVKPNSLAVRVKLNDLTDNMDIRRWHTFPDDATERLRKYWNAYKALTILDK